MAIRRILTVDKDEASLRKMSRPVLEFNERLFLLLDDLHDTLKKADGLGLAAPQVGILKRVAIVVDADAGQTFELINPEIIAAEGEIISDEGCLSIPKRYEKIKRPAKVTVKTRILEGWNCKISFPPVRRRIGRGRANDLRLWKNPLYFDADRLPDGLRFLRVGLGRPQAQFKRRRNDRAGTNRKPRQRRGQRQGPRRNQRGFDGKRGTARQFR